MARCACTKPLQTLDEPITPGAQLQILRQDPARLAEGRNSLHYPPLEEICGKAESRARVGDLGWRAQILCQQEDRKAGQQ